MFSSKKIMLSAVACLLGFMLVLQFQTTNQPEKRDTRDVWQLREDLSQEKMQTQQLNAERREVESLLYKYGNNEGQQKVETMKNALSELKKETGLTKVSGQGIILTVEPLVSGSLAGQEYHPVTTELLRRLLNELNAFGAEEMAIGNERVVATTPIRDVSGEVYVNDRRVPDVPFKIKVLSKNPQKLHDEMVVSQSGKDFAEAELQLTAKRVNDLTLPAYDRPILVQHMKSAEGGS